MSERTERLAGMSPEKLQRLIDSLRAKAPAPAVAAPAIPRRPAGLDRLPLSFSQERLWFLDRLEPGSPAFNLPAAVELRGNLRGAALAAALAEVVRRHESLRTTFAEANGIPVQRIAAPGEAPLALPRIDLSGLPEEPRGREAARLASEHAAWRFDLARGPLLAAALLRLEERRHHLLLAMHHIVSDGWSMGVLIREVAALYAAFVEGKPSPLPEIPIQYPDFALWQREAAAAEREKDLAWWSERLGGQTEPLDLPTDRPRPAVQTWRGGWVIRTLPAGLSDRLRSFGQAEGASLFMTMLAGVQALLHRLAGRDDVVVGSPIAGRRMTETEPLIGFFLNLLALRTDVSGNPGFKELVGRVRDVTLGAYAHQDLPFEALLAHLQPERDLSRTPLFQVLFNLLNFPLTEQRLPGLEIEAISLPDLPSKFDLTFYVRDDPGGIAIRLAYNADLFDAVRMEELVDQLALLLAAGLENPELGVDRISLAATPLARAMLPDAGVELSAAWEGAVHEVFARHARQAPAALAAADPAESWTYGELHERSDRLAAFLQAQGVRQGDVVAFWAHRSAPLVWGVLGALKAGAAFLMLDPRYPAPRQAQMLEIARPAAWLRVAAAGPVPAEIESALDALGGLRGTCRLTLPARADDAGFLADGPAEPSAVEIGPNDVAYVAFTSGSTGVPKGVLGRHGSLSHFIPWLRERFELSASDRFSMLSGLAHDPLHRDLFTPLQTGAAIVIPDPDTMDEPGRLAAWMRREGVTVAHLTPALGQVLTTEAPHRTGAEVPSLRYVFLVGDVLTRRDVARLRRLAPAVTVVNYYGSTETQRAVGYHVAEEEGAKEILPLGRGIPDVQILVLNPSGALAGVGELGEISIRSPHIALGYLGDPQLTAQRFVGDLYRTGDLGRYLPNGEAVFVGRADTQVKIRGFRIELGEIEAVLGRFPGVREAVVIARQDRAPERYLAAYVVPAAGANLATRELRAFLRERLPDSMVPTTFTLLDELPLTPNRKVDRKALPAPDRGAEEAGFVAPESDLEREIAAIWQEVLGVERVGVRDNFFELGGHSLLGTQLLSRLRDELGVELPIAALFESPTAAELAARIEEARGGVAEIAPPVERLPRTGLPVDLPLSFAQERLWFLDQLQPGSAAYNIPSALRLEGPLDVAALASALTEVARRHESLRTTFPSIDGAPVQRIAPPGPFPLTVVDLSGLPEETREAEGARLVVEEPRAPFDLASGPLARASVVRLGARGHLLLTTQHHVISDGWSLGLFVREVAALYRAFAAGEKPALPELPVQYADFAAWQRNWLSGPVLERQVAWWREWLTPTPPVLEIPLDRPRLAAETFRGGRQSLALPAELTGTLAALGRERGATLFMALLAGFQALLSRLTHQEDVTVGSPIAGRTRGEVESLIGLFINTLVLRTDLAGDPTFLEALARVREMALGAYAHQELPFERLVEELRPERALGHSPLFQVLFILQNFPSEEVEAAGLALRPLDVYHGVARFDLTLSATEIAGGLLGYLEYKTDLLDGATAARWLGHLGTLLAAAVAEPDRRLSELPLLADAERRQILESWNDTAADVPAACVHQLIAERAARSPEEVAVVFEGEQLTRAELEERAARLAGRLRALGAGPESLVGIALERSLDLLVATLGVWKAGAAYLPLDPGYPAERLGFMLADSGVQVVLTHERLTATLPEHGARVLCLDREPEGEAEPVHDGGASPDHLAYVLYTSGSTGRPKGVQVTHGALTNFLASMLRQPGLVESDVLLAVTSLSFDIAGLELYLPLLAGARLEIASAELTADGARLASRLRESGVTVLQATPATWRMLLEAGWEEPAGLRLALCGGEALPADLAAQLRRRAGAVWNLYGPTETTIWSAVYPAEEGAAGAIVPIGHPIANTQIHVLDRRMVPVPPGVPGEAWIGGAGVARGYLGRPDLTAERFVPDPFSAAPGARLYRTGDLVRTRPDGTREFLGRADHQVKVRGHRIELGEIEAALALHPAVAQAAVVVRADWGDSRLVAYVVPAAGQEARTVELRAFLRERLPEFMEPSAFVTLAALPLTPNRKVDRKALPAPEAAAAAGAFVAPRNPIEEVLAGLWAEVLGVERVGIDDDFFALGGHSLLATRIASRVARVLGTTPPVRWIFERPTVRGLGDRIAQATRDAGGEPEPPITPVSRTGDLPLSFAQERLWFLDRFQPGGTAYNMPVALRLEGDLDLPALAAALAEIVRRHEALRTSFPERGGRPYQEIAPPGPVALPLLDLTDLPAGRRDAELAERLAAEARRPFDLLRGPLLRATLLRLGTREHALALATHHIVGDAWSIGLFVRELSTLYAVAARGERSPLPELPVQYADFATWQRQWLTRERLSRLAAAWRERLAGAPAALELPTDRPYPPAQTFRGGSIAVRLRRELASGVDALTRREGASLFMTLLAAFQALLHRYSGQEDLIVGTPVAGRSRPEIEGVIGVFLNTLPLRGDLHGDPSFRELLARSRETALEAYTLQDLPFERLLEELQPPRDLSRPPLFQTLLILQNAPAEALTLQGLGFSLVPVETGTAKLELLLSLGEGGGEIGGYLEYNADLFDRSTGGRLVRHFETLLAGAVADPETRLSELPLLSAGEREQLVRGWNHTAAPVPAAAVHELFEAQVDLTPGAVAVQAGAERLTFAELDARANRLAHHLRGLGVGPEVLVGLSVERSAAMVVALLGILKAGGAYLPLDPAYPRERLAYMLEDSGARVVVTEQTLLASLPEHRAATVLLDGDAAEIAARPAGRPGLAPASDGLAYVLYTSGSTGRPKGVQVPHGALVNFLLSMRERPGMSESDVLVAVTSLSFDIAGLEIYLPLLASARLVVASREETQDGARLRDLLARSGATVLQATPATWRLLIESGWTGSPGLRALCGGEALPEDLAATLLERCGAVWNLYGPTETTIWSTVSQVLPRRPISIGRPIANTTAHLLDSRGALVPVGVPGELLLGGTGVTRGYLGRPDLTAERFVPDPFGEPGGRLYRTGDLVRRRADGELESLGRLDHQVKVRGFRIELGEIEAALRSHPAVAQAVAGVRDLKEGKALVAWVVPAASASAEPAVLREHLRTRLPEHMLPGAWVVLSALPLTPNGKIDRKALPNPERAPAAVYEPPRSGLEREIAAIWQELLGVEQVGLHDNFFELGGHSLLIPRLQARLRESLGREVGVVDLFGHPTVASLARRLSPPAAALAERSETRPPRVRRGGSEIAILAMAGRFPQAADLEQFWKNLRDGVEAITFFSEEELAASGLPAELLRSPGFVRAGAVLEDADLFDAELFGILPSEAELIDPQQRLLLECAWEALEKAGHAGTKRPVGVFAGTSENTYLLHNLLPDPEVVSSAGMLGLTVASSRDFVATRLAYKLDLAGPAISVQTACSTSLVAVHMACQSLLAGECELALAGGSSIRVPQRTGYTWQAGGISSPDGHCRAFDARAQGTVPGQGTGIVVLKRLDDALADGDPILAVIKGSALNNDGALKAGFTAPSPEGQAQVIRAAQLQAGIDPATIGYVEAHGTATPLGDPIEVAALTRAFGQGTDQRGYCALGSVKTNIGHLDAAAGVAGLIKAVLSLEHREIPPSLHFEAPNPEIDFAASPFYVNTQHRPWPQLEGVPRRAGVSSFGLGGTNAHVVLEEAPPSAPSGPSRPWQLLLLSAATPAALERATDNLAGHLSTHPEQSLADVAWTLQVGRKTFRHRRALVAGSAEEAAALLAGRDPKRVWTLAGERGDRPVAFLLPGVGDQYTGMARQLYESEPLFREELDRCAAILLPLLDLDIRESLLGELRLEEPTAEGGGEVDLRAMLRRGGAPRPESPLHSTRVAQPAMLALGWSLARLWMSWGVRPQALLGYSLGEYTAACLAGVLTIEDGLALATRRAELIETLPAGAMLAVPLPEAEIAALLPSELSLAAVNAPSVCVVSGPAAAIADFELRLAADGLPCRRLGTAHAFHSPEMEPIAGAFRALLESVRLAPPQLPYVSNVTGTWITPGQATDPGYWVEHLLRTVRFADGVAELWREPGRVLLEMGPGQALASLAAQQGDSAGLALASLPHEMDGRPAQQVLLGTLGQLWLAGAEIDWEGFRGAEKRRRVPLPGTSFERKRFWIEPRRPQAPSRQEPAFTVGRLPEMADWFHAPLWKPSVRPAKNGAGHGPWLLLADELGIGTELALRLRAAGLEAETVPAGDLVALEQALERSPSRIVHLWTLGSGADGDIREPGFHGLMALARTLGHGGRSGAPGERVHLDIVTAGLCQVDRKDRLDPEKAVLLGPVRVIPQEYPRIHCRAIDIDPAERRNDVIAQLLTELQGGGAEPLVAWRGRQRLVPGWEPVRLGGEEASPFRENGAYLITGGTGGIGLALAGHLARTVHARLALVSRRGLPEDSAAVRELEAAGAEVLVLRADVADEEQMRRALAAARERFGPLHGVFHAAGIPGAGLIQLKSREAADAVLAPKVDGTRILQTVLAEAQGDAPPELLVLFSSINSVIGGLGQVDYCAANAYLDAVAEAGAGELPWVAIDWCEWQWDAWTEATIADPGIVAELRRHRETYGLRFEEGMEALERVLASGLRRVVVSTRDLRAVLAQRHSLPEILGGLDHRAETARSGRATRPRPDLPVPYTPPDIEDHQRLAVLWRDLLALEEIGIHDDFFQLGGHSLLGLQLLSRLQSAFGVEVPLRTLFDAPTIAELSVAIHDLRAGQGTPVTAEKIAAIDPQSLLENLQELSDEEMNELLARMATQEDLTS